MLDVRTWFFFLLASALAATGSAFAQARHPHVVAGFDFDELRYVDTTRNNKIVAFHGGVFRDAAGDLPTLISIDDVIAGALDGIPVAVVVQRGEGPGGYSEWADLFSIGAGGAQRLETIGRFDYFTTGEGPYPQRWSAFHFAQNRLYADIWNDDAKCDAQHDWIVTTYALHDGKLLALKKLEHHREGMPVPQRAQSDGAYTCTYA